MNEYEFNHSVSELAQFRMFDLLSDMVGRVRFVQVGANDGKSADAIHPYVVHRGWYGALVEPVPYLFERLKQNYAAYPDLLFYQVCCARTEGMIPFYMVEQDAELKSLMAPFLSSFDKQVILRHKMYIPELESNIREVPIETVRVDRILERSGYNEIDLLMVDTEGTDDDVALSLDYQRYRPEIVVVEHKHIPYSSLRAMDSALECQGYGRMRLFQDTLFMGPRMWANPEVRRWAEAGRTLFEM